MFECEKVCDSDVLSRVVGISTGPITLAEVEPGMCCEGYGNSRAGWDGQVAVMFGRRIWIVCTFCMQISFLSSKFTQIDSAYDGFTSGIVSFCILGIFPR